MMISANQIIDRAEKIFKLRLGKNRVEANVDYSWEVARICKRLGDRWYARGNTIIEREYGN